MCVVGATGRFRASLTKQETRATVTLISHSACVFVVVDVTLNRISSQNQHETMSTQSLLDAIEKKDRDAVRELLLEGVDVNCKLLDNARSPLVWACIIGDVAIVSMLLDAGGAIDGEDGD